ncbi:hypothetical protein M5689_024600 [Euphorbia peplus]|nr:hypothetical protein M5689_024600 [Euphorbia peplus]
MEFCVEGRRVIRCVSTGATEVEEEEAPIVVGEVETTLVEGAVVGCGIDGDSTDTKGGHDIEIVGDVAVGAGEKGIAEIVIDEETTEGEEAGGGDSKGLEDINSLEVVEIEGKLGEGIIAVGSGLCKLNELK